MGETNINFSFGGLLTIQIMLWVLHYGDLITLPLWLVWLPCIIVAILLIIILILLAVFAVAAIWG